MKLLFNLPNFDGFYNSGLGDFEISEDGDVTEEEYDPIKWDKTFENIGRKYLDKFNEQNENLLKLIELKPFTFVSIDSPREYNFRTDYLVCECSFNFARLIKVFKQLINEHIEQFEDLIKERHSSRSGFVSFYSDDLKVWLSEYLTTDKFDNVIFETLLQFALDVHPETEYDSDEIYEHTIETQYELIEY